MLVQFTRSGDKYGVRVPQSVHIITQHTCIRSTTTLVPDEDSAAWIIITTSMSQLPNFSPARPG